MRARCGISKYLICIVSRNKSMNKRIQIIIIIIASVTLLGISVYQREHIKILNAQINILNNQVRTLNESTLVLNNRVRILNESNLEHIEKTTNLERTFENITENMMSYISKLEIQIFNLSITTRKSIFYQKEILAFNIISENNETFVSVKIKDTSDEVIWYFNTSEKWYMRRNEKFGYPYFYQISNGMPMTFSSQHLEGMWVAEVYNENETKLFECYFIYFQNEKESGIEPVIVD